MDSKRQKLNGAETQITSENDAVVLNAVFNPHAPFDMPASTAAEIQDVAELEEVSPEIKKLEIDAVNAAQNGDFTTSMEMFEKVIGMAPEYASVYNNRAQLLRIQGDNEDALNDLNTAIQLSGGKGLAASQAYCQRAMLHQLNGNCEDGENDFRAAAALGNAFAKSQLVSMNPYSALCNQMLGEVFSRVRNGEPDLQ